MGIPVERKKRPVLLRPDMLSKPVDHLREYFEVEHLLSLRPPFMMTVIILMSVVFLWSGYTYIMNPSDNLIEEGQFQGHWLVSYEGWMRMVTSSFLHAGIEHFLGNVTILYISGIMLEHLYGLEVLACVYLITLLGQGLASYVHYDAASATVGASGVVFGLVGLLSMFYFRYGRQIFVRYRTVAIVFVLLGLHAIYMGLSSSRVNNAAHVGGFVSGLLCGLIYRPLFARGVLDDFGRLPRPGPVKKWARRGILIMTTVIVLTPFAIMQTRLSPHGNISFWDQFTNFLEFVFSPRGVKAPDVTYWTIRGQEKVEIKAPPKDEKGGSEPKPRQIKTPVPTPTSMSGGKVTGSDQNSKETEMAANDASSDQGKQCPLCSRDSEGACECPSGCQWTYFHHFEDAKCQIKLKTTVWGPNTGSPFKLGFGDRRCIEYLGRYYSWEWPRQDCYAPTDQAEPQ